jgi:L-aspartate oxidase
LEEIRTFLRRAMWEWVGIIRCSESLGNAREKFLEWMPVMNMTFMTRRGLECKNMFTVGQMITEAALARKGSVGAHYTSDFPTKGEDWQRHVALSKAGNSIKTFLT